MKAVIYHQPGGADVLRYVDMPDPACPPDGVLIRVEAISIEGGDVITRAALPLEPGHVPGYAAAGEVLAVGANVRDRHVGQKVTSFDIDGSHASLRAVKASRTWPVPAGLGMAAAAALPISFGTAHHCLFARGALTAGEIVLVQAGAGGVGLAAIQLAHRAGARVVATVSGPERTERLIALGADHTVNYRQVDVLQEVKRLTAGDGVDLVIDPVGSTLDGSLAALKPEGRLVFVGNAGGSSLAPNLWPALQHNQTLLGVFMGTQFEKPPVHRTVSDMLERAAQGELEMIIAETFPLAEAARAHACAENRTTIGRVIMTP
ncbi:NADP-dependent oxidoreductase [Pleomorphomonas carboxyditropha]|uniref:NADP-dependent oxidoreductase n=2 Tax=Pleomorphomonas carboxyditropha TaxID=2023338 RepID=A0A2G9X102_9HYPH|nr:zinc-binding alcohol dehydrogenase family protein [Pleomorphomonas carboxyditropha]PIP00600.1 NADP-dependent oxidoreductase [Pleomorphomonas carboxyditropha]